MGDRQKKTIGAKKTASRKETTIEKLEQGLALVKTSSLFSRLGGWICLEKREDRREQCAATVDRNGRIFLNSKCNLEPEEWAYVIAHCRLHLAFGHFDEEKMPGYEKLLPDGSEVKKVQYDVFLWNMACDIYIAKFLADIKYGKAICENPSECFPIALREEEQIYGYLLEHQENQQLSANWSVNGKGMDMIGLDRPIHYGENEKNRFAEEFAATLVRAASEEVTKAGGYDVTEMAGKSTKSYKAAQWFINHYPLLGGVAAGFQIIESRRFCWEQEIQIAAVNAKAGEIYVNPAAGLKEEELRFVLAHEFLHAGLQHQERCQGRNEYLWNVACDYVINGWLLDLNIGKMPEGVLYDAKLKDMSAEAIYDRILSDMRKYMKENTLRGYGKGDMFGGTGYGKMRQPGVSLDEFYRDSLAQGLEYHQSTGRGLIPAGLVEEIRALSMPVIPWDVELAQWFDNYFPDQEKKRTYARPSRRQGATPDIPRPRYAQLEHYERGRTFGVVVDTSGSMSVKMLGMALGSIASFAEAKEVAYVRVVFCDAAAYDAGYLSPEEIAGRVEVKGRGGTRLQPGIDLLEYAKDFPDDGPILIITDGEIEDRLWVQHEHAYLLPKGRRLPFRARGKVFGVD